MRFGLFVRGFSSSIGSRSGVWTLSRFPSGVVPAAGSNGGAAAAPFGKWKSVSGSTGETIVLSNCATLAEAQHTLTGVADQAHQSVVYNLFPWSPVPDASAAQASDMIFELRTYRVQAGGHGRWGDRFSQALPARMPLSAPLGVWFSESGPLNQVMHIWPYQSLEHRAEVRAAAVKVEPWLAMVGDNNPVIEEMKSEILIPQQ